MNEPDSTPAPEAWPRAQALTRLLWSPVERFLHIEAASGLLLLAAAAIGLVWANSPWAHSYEALWHAKVSIGVGPFVFSQTLHFVINEGLMALFFFLVGLEIRREMHDGELASVKQATLPIAAALGGMLAPALIYLALSAPGAAQRGFGVPMATDIAFAVGVLSLLGRRAPPALRVLLLSLAIIDDIGAILVIAIFYSSGISTTGMAIAAAGVLCVVAFQRFGVRRARAYLAPGLVVWIGLLQAGVHPTLTGVLVGLLTPVRAWFGTEGFTAAATDTLAQFERHAQSDGRDPKLLLAPLERMRRAHRETLAPVVRLEAALHPWIAFAIMPLFALANAGVDLSGVDLAAEASSSVVWGVTLGLCVGKPLGVMLACYALVKLGGATLPSGVGWGGVLLVGLLAGIGFTMAIFIAGLAFPDPGLLSAAKLAVLIASAGAAILGLCIGFAASPRRLAAAGQPR